MILYTPLDIPRIEPNDWEEWWKVWETRDYLSKVVDNHNYDSSAHLNWRGLDLYYKPNAKAIYRAKQATKSPVVDNLVQQVFDCFQVDIDVIRVIENEKKIDFHSDNTIPSPQIRSVLWSTYSNPLWNLEYKNQYKSIGLPKESNSFYFLDHPMKHEAEYEDGKSKGLLVVYSTKFYGKTTLDLVKRSSERFKEYMWEVK